MMMNSCEESESWRLVAAAVVVAVLRVEGGALEHEEVRLMDL